MSQFSLAPELEMQFSKDDFKNEGYELQKQMEVLFDPAHFGSDVFQEVLMSRKEVLERTGGRTIKKDENVILVRPPVSKEGEDPHDWIWMGDRGVQKLSKDIVQDKTESQLSRMEGSGLAQYFNDKRAQTYSKFWRSYVKCSNDMYQLGNLLKKINRRRLNGSHYQEKLDKMRTTEIFKEKKKGEGVKCSVCDDTKQSVKNMKVCDWCKKSISSSSDIIEKTLIDLVDSPSPPSKRPRPHTGPQTPPYDYRIEES